MKNIFFSFIAIFITILISCNKEDDPNPNSTANTVTFFSEFSTRTPYQEKVIDNDGNLYTYISERGTYEIGENSRFEVSRNNTLIKLDAQANYLTEYAGVVPLSFGKLALGNNDVIYMKSERLNSNSIVKMSTDGSFVSTNPITSFTEDMDAMSNGDYFVLESGVKKYTEDNQLIWSTGTGEEEDGEGFRLLYNDLDESLLVLSRTALSKYNATNGDLLWSYSIEGMACSVVYSSPERCISGFMDVDEIGDVYLAFIKNGIVNTSTIDFVEVIKLNADGQVQFTKTLRSEADFVEDIFITGLTAYDGSFYMAVNSTTRSSPFSAEKAYIGKYSGNTGDEVWRQSPSWKYVSLDDYAPSEFSFGTNTVFIKDLVQSKTDGKLLCSIAIGIPNKLSDPNSTGEISKVVVKTQMGSFTHEETHFLNTIELRRNWTMLNP